MVHKFERYCDRLTEIENYELAKADNFKGWDCHHKLGEFSSRKELKDKGLYYHRPSDELIFLKRKEHFKRHNWEFTKEHKENISKGTKEAMKKDKVKNKLKKPRTEFGKKFFEHFGFTNSENHKLYDREYKFYIKHNKICRWEVPC